MDSAPHLPPQGALLVYEWYEKAQIQYADHYIWLYISYNSWYQAAVGTTNDRQALDKLKKRFIIWDDYTQGKTMPQLRLYLERLAELTQREPLSGRTLYWSGSIEGPYDWRSLIEFWYQVRCRLVHGTRVRPRYVWLAYETLNIFMEEILSRMKRCFSEADLQKIQELSITSAAPVSKTKRFRQLQAYLYQKYVASPNIWDVDMKRVSEEAP